MKNPSRIEHTPEGENGYAFACAAGLAQDGGDLLTTQRDTTTRELNESSARNQYIHAKINLENVLGEILRDYDVSIDEALKGQVSRQADQPPAVPRQ